MKRLVCLLLVLVCVFSFRVNAVSTSAKSAILINGDTGEVLYEQNADKCLPMASTTKIMTALLLSESNILDKEFTVEDKMIRVEGSSMGLLPNDKVTGRDLLYGMMLASGNDAANMTAYILGGTVDGFVKKMNQKAQALGLQNTNFETPSGLDGDEHYTTARDLAKLTRYALQNEEFYKAASCQSATLCYGNPPYKRTLTNHNKLLKTYSGAVGVKTGFTKKSGRCLVSAAKRDGEFLIAVTLGDPNDWADHTALLDYGFERVETKEITPKQTSYTIPVISASSSLNVKIEPLTISYADDSEFSCKVLLPRFVYAPVKKGEVLGCVVYKKDGKEFKREEITAKRDIELPQPDIGFNEKIKEIIKYIFNGIWEI